MIKILFNSGHKCSKIAFFSSKSVVISDFLFDNINEILDFSQYYKKMYNPFNNDKISKSSLDILNMKDYSSRINLINYKINAKITKNNVHDKLNNIKGLPTF